MYVYHNSISGFYLVIGPCGCCAEVNTLPPHNDWRKEVIHDVSPERLVQQVQEEYPEALPWLKAPGWSTVLLDENNLRRGVRG